MRTARIFLAEDQPELRALVASALRADGHHVRELARGDELLHAIVTASERGGLPDLLISDVHMPGMSALDALELARARVPSLTVVLMTGGGDPDMVARAGRLDVACILGKPFNLGAMRAAVLSLLAIQRTTER